MPDDLIIDDPFPPSPMMMDSIVEEFGVEGVLVLLCRELEVSTRKTDIFACSHIRALVGQLAAAAAGTGESITTEKKQRWLGKHGFDIDG